MVSRTELESAFEHYQNVVRDASASGDWALFAGLFTDEGGAECECVQMVQYPAWEKYQPGDPVPPFEYLRSRPWVTRRVTPPGQWKAPLPCGLPGLALAGLLWITSRRLRRPDSPRRDRESPRVRYR